MFKSRISITCIFFLFAQTVFAAESTAGPATQPPSNTNVTVVSCVWANTQKVGYYVVSYGKSAALTLFALPEKAWNDLMQRYFSSPRSEVIKVSYGQEYADTIKEYELTARQLDQLGCGQQELTSGVPITPKQLEIIRQNSVPINPILLERPFTP